jgi:hypothetical protein
MLLELKSMCPSFRARGDGLFPTVFLLLLAVALLGCSHSGNEPPTRQTALGADTAPGTILVDVLESGHPENYWQYEVRPATGSVQKVKQERFEDYAHEDIPHIFNQPAGAIESCRNKPEATSLDERYLAYCTRSGADEFFVIDQKTKEMTYHWKAAEWREINGFAWAPNSHSVAFLNMSSYYGKNPIELLSGLTGHPVPHDTIYLDVLDVHNWNTTEYLVRSDVPYSFERILNWSK